MVTDNEAAFRRLIELTNPTGALHSATPWAAAGDHEITAAGAVIAQFRHREDRDVALYFTNVHAGMIGLLRSGAEAWDFIARGCGFAPDTGVVSFATNQAELCRTYAELFCRLGKPLDE